MRRGWHARQIRFTLRCAGICGQDVERHRARQHSSMWMHFSGAAGRGSRSDSKLSVRRRRGAEQGDEVHDARSTSELRSLSPVCDVMMERLPTSAGFVGAAIVMTLAGVVSCGLGIGFVWAVLIAIFGILVNGFVAMRKMIFPAASTIPIERTHARVRAPSEPDRPSAGRPTNQHCRGWRIPGGTGRTIPISQP
jgi:hypothetical protein